MEIAYGEPSSKELDRSAGRAWMGCEAWKKLEGSSEQCRTIVDGM